MAPGQARPKVANSSPRVRRRPLRLWPWPGRRSCAVVPRRRRRGRCASRSVTNRSSAAMAQRPEVRNRASRRVAPGSGGMTRAGAGPVSSTRSATVADAGTTASNTGSMRRRSVRRDVGRMVVTGILGILLVASYTTYRIWAQGQIDDKRPADAIVVLGAAQYDGRPSPVFAARLDHAIALYRAGIAPWLVVTGGRRAGDRTTEAATARGYAVRRGIPAEAIIGEDGSTNTLTSIRAVSSLLTDRGLSRAVFVSDPSHMLRVLRMARDTGIDAYGSATPSSPVERDPRALVHALAHEIAGLGMYFVTGESP